MMWATHPHRAVCHGYLHTDGHEGACGRSREKSLGTRVGTGPGTDEGDELRPSPLTTVAEPTREREGRGQASRPGVGLVTRARSRVVEKVGPMALELWSRNQCTAHRSSRRLGDHGKAVPRPARSPIDAGQRVFRGDRLGPHETVLTLLVCACPAQFREEGKSIEGTLCRNSGGSTLEVEWPARSSCWSSCSLQGLADFSSGSSPSLPRPGWP